MKVSINNSVIDIFTGAHVYDVLMFHSPELLKKAEAGTIVVLDGDGNEVELSGATAEGSIFQLKETSENDSE